MPSKLRLLALPLMWSRWLMFEPLLTHSTKIQWWRACSVKSTSSCSERTYLLQVPPSPVSNTLWCVHDCRSGFAQVKSPVYYKDAHSSCSWIWLSLVGYLMPLSTVNIHAHWKWTVYHYNYIVVTTNVKQRLVYKLSVSFDNTSPTLKYIHNRSEHKTTIQALYVPFPVGIY